MLQEPVRCPLDFPAPDRALCLKIGQVSKGLAAVHQYGICSCFGLGVFQMKAGLLILLAFGFLIHFRHPFQIPCQKTGTCWFAIGRFLGSPLLRTSRTFTAGLMQEPKARRSSSLAAFAASNCQIVDLLSGFGDIYPDLCLLFDGV
ncbi:MAG: hypothetical protein A4E47_00596 [Methanosaeta sp. PtaU1.Bin028]|nr:MAG: hypothetical protein A4E47_00596 [Methanosaeta sp. PtaU1.Bin028]